MTVAEKLISSVPDEYKDGSVLTDFAQALASDLQVVQDKIDTLPTILSVDTPDENLDWLLERVAWNLSEHYPVHVKREVLKRHADWNKRYGQTGLIEEIVEVYTRPSVDGRGVKIRVEVHPNKATWTAGNKNFAGKMMLNNVYTQNGILITLLDYGTVSPDINLFKRLSGIFQIIVPAWMQYEFISAIQLISWTAGFKDYAGKMMITRV